MYVVAILLAITTILYHDASLRLVWNSIYLTANIFMSGFLHLSEQFVTGKN
jgi:hypothetical protein